MTSYLKSALVGVFALVTFAAVILCAEFVAATIWIRAHGGNESVFVGFSIKSPFIWAIALFIFGAGFCWEYRSLTR
jgi:hypothetical protein